MFEQRVDNADKGFGVGFDGSGGHDSPPAHAAAWVRKVQYWDLIPKTTNSVRCPIHCGAGSVRGWRGATKIRPPSVRWWVAGERASIGSVHESISAAFNSGAPEKYSKQGPTGAENFDGKGKNSCMAAGTVRLARALDRRVRSCLRGCPALDPWATSSFRVDVPPLRPKKYKTATDISVLAIRWSG
jgi:hypothetical protein